MANLLRTPSYLKEDSYFYSSRMNFTEQGDFTEKEDYRKIKVETESPPFTPYFRRCPKNNKPNTSETMSAKFPQNSGFNNQVNRQYFSFSTSNNYNSQNFNRDFDKKERILEEY